MSTWRRMAPSRTSFAAGAIIGVALTVSLFGVSRLGVCAIASCHRVFIDSSPGRSRRYCTEHVTAKGNVSTLRRQPADRSLAAPAARGELGLDGPLLFLYQACYVGRLCLG